jgi:hypothetical protein
MTYKRYTLVLLALFLPILTVVPVLNWIVDPFWYFRNVEISGFNQMKPDYHLYERQVKSALLTKLHPQAVILGSSFAEIGLPVTHPGFTDEGKLKSFNLSLPSLNGAELYCYALFTLSQPGVKRLVLGGFGLEAAPCTKYQNLGEVDYTNLLLGKTAFRATLDTLRHQEGRQESTADGMWSYKRYRSGLVDDSQILTTFADAFRGKLCPSPQRNRALDYARIDRSKPPNDASTAGLRNIIRLARQNNIQLILIDFPKHVLNYEEDRECGRTEAYWSGLWKIAAIVEEEAGPDSNLVEFWTFYGYRELNAERIHAGLATPQRLWQDDGHFNPEVGQVVFDAIFGSDKSFGHKVTTRDFGRMVAEGESERRTYLASHAWVQQELDEIRQTAQNRKGKGEPPPEP